MTPLFSLKPKTCLLTSISSHEETEYWIKRKRKLQRLFATHNLSPSTSVWLLINTTLTLWCFRIPLSWQCYLNNHSVPCTDSHNTEKQREGLLPYLECSCFTPSLCLRTCQRVRNPESWRQILPWNSRSIINKWRQTISQDG